MGVLLGQKHASPVHTVFGIGAQHMHAHINKSSLFCWEWVAFYAFCVLQLLG